MEHLLQVTVDGTPLGSDTLGLLSRLEVRESDFDATVAALRFRLAQGPRGEVSPLDDELFLPAAKLAVKLTVRGSTPTPLFEGYVTHVRPHFEQLEANCYVEILAMDAAVLMGAEERVASYPDSTDAQAAEDVFSRYHLPFEGEPTAARHEERGQLLVQRGTDWDFVRQLARRNGFCCYLEPDPVSGTVTAHFKRRSVEGSPQPELVLLHPEANLRWLDLQLVTTGPVRQVGASIDPLAKRLVRAEGDAVLAPMGRQPMEELVRRLESAGAQGTTALLRDPVPLDAAIQAEGSGATDRSSFAVEMRGELDVSEYGGLLRARRPVLVKGVGLAFAGTYYVRTVRTTLEGSGLSQTFVGQRNALGLTGSEPFGQGFGEGGRP
jgi:phage protein D